MTDQPDTSYGDEPAEDDGVLEPADSLDGDDLTADLLDTGIDAGEGYRAATRFGTTAEEERQGESLDQLLAEEEPDSAADDEWTDEDDPRDDDHTTDPAVRPPGRAGRRRARRRRDRRRRRRRRHRRRRRSRRGGRGAPDRRGRRRRGSSPLTCEPRSARSRPWCTPTSSPVSRGRRLWHARKRVRTVGERWAVESVGYWHSVFSPEFSTVPKVRAVARNCPLCVPPPRAGCRPTRLRGR